MRTVQQSKKKNHLLGDIGPSLVPPEELNSLLGASEALHRVGNHQRHLKERHKVHVMMIATFITGIRKEKNAINYQ